MQDKDFHSIDIKIYFNNAIEENFLALGKDAYLDTRVYGMPSG